MKEWVKYHPYKPYDIQLQLMDAIYDALDNNYKIGIFESPTGTGKTLSLICATMTWLRDYKRNHIFDHQFDNQSDNTNSDSDDPDWVNSTYKDTIVARSKSKIVDYELHLDKLQLQYDNNQVSNVDELPVKKFKSSKSKHDHNDDFDDVDSQYLPSDFIAHQLESENTKITREINQLIMKNSNTHVSSFDCPINIYFSSRTHSQLNQFAHQLSLPTLESSFIDINERVKFLPLGGRKQLCINDNIRKYNDSSINDACIDLQTKSGCDYKSKNLDTKYFIDLSLTKIHDIEDLADLGKKLNICPYYSIRDGLNIPEIISLPYQLLLQDSSRQAINLNIENSIIIIDEAHNLIDSITSLYSVCLNLNELTQIITSLKLYLSKFIKRLNSGNRINLSKLIKLCQTIQEFIQESISKKLVVIGQNIPHDSILSNSNADLHNIYKLDEYLSKTKIAYKIESYIEKMNQDNNSDEKRLSNPLLFKIVKFLKCLNHPSNEGRFFWSESNLSVTINYMLLDPSAAFSQIITQAKCIILCGGTMEPIEEFYDYLFPQVPENQIKTFNCGHVIPQENLEVIPIKDWNNFPFKFLFTERNDRIMIERLGHCIHDLCESIPGGVVTFFPSYNYLNQVIKLWKTSGIYSKITQVKQILQEPTDSSKVELVLQEHSQAIRNNGLGSLLLSVVGGKMSEGINFSDDLARAIIMVGLPYPNAYSGEIIAKRNFIETKTLENGGTKAEAHQKSQDFYENICMRAINQSIGRSIRHINDYSIIYLIDQRFDQPRIQNKLSGWVKDRIIKDNPSTAMIIEKTKSFFMSKSVSKNK